MGFFEIALLGVALSMDAAAVGMTDGMSEDKLGWKKMLLIGLFFGVFQALMPLIGYFLSGFVAEAFFDVFKKISGFVSFALLAFLGIKMILEAVKELRERKEEEQKTCLACGDEPNCAEALQDEKKTLSLGKLFMQAIATSIDALAVGVTLEMAALTGDLPLGIFPSVAVIGILTFAISTFAVFIGKKIGNGLAEKAEFLGGGVLILIGVKLLIEGLL